MSAQRKPAECEPEAVQIATLLGLPKPGSYDALKLADNIERGVPVRSIEYVVSMLDPRAVMVKGYDLVPKTTLARKKAGEGILSRDASNKLWQLTRVFVEARRQYHSDEAARNFMLRPHPLLDGRRPYDVARGTPAGADLVLQLLGEAEAGVAV